MNEIRYSYGFERGAQFGKLTIIAGVLKILIYIILYLSSSMRLSLGLEDVRSASRKCP